MAYLIVKKTLSIAGILFQNTNHPTGLTLSQYPNLIPYTNILYLI